MSYRNILIWPRDDKAREIREHLKEIYHEVSSDLISTIAAKVLEEVTDGKEAKHFGRSVPLLPDACLIHQVYV